MSVKLSSYVWDGCAANGVKGTKLLIMARLADFSNDDGVSWYGIETIARQIGAGRSTVITLIGDLEKNGWLTRKSRRQGQRNTSNLYTLNVAKLRKAADTSYTHSSKSEPSESEHSESEHSESERSENGKNRVSHGSESGPDPSVNSKHDPSLNSKPSCPVASQPDAPSDSEDPALRVLTHFNEITDSSYRNKKTTMGYIRARLAEDYTADDLILVADYLTAKWLNDPKMGDYLRPKTLYGPENCAEYFEKARKWLQAGRPACINGKWIKPGVPDIPGGLDFDNTDWIYGIEDDLQRILSRGGH